MSDRKALRKALRNVSAKKVRRPHSTFSYKTPDEVFLNNYAIEVFLP
jgi:hypothetical protein